MSASDHEEQDARDLRESYAREHHALATPGSIYAKV